MCKRLRLWEQKAYKITLRLCDGPEYPKGEAERLLARILKSVNKLLGNIRRPNQPKVPIFINQDARGLALKIDGDFLRKHNLSLPGDMGGDGILAPYIEV